MDKAVLFSIKPKHCENIIIEIKKVEVRKKIPKISVPFPAYIYETKGRKIINPTGEVLHEGRGKVIGEFVCNNIDWHGISSLIVKEDAEHTLEGTCLSKDEVLKYIGYQKGTNIYAKDYSFYGLHISDLVIYEEPKDLSEFATICEGLKPYQCDKCEYSYTESDESIGVYHECCCNNLKPLKRPPQSWCYVKKLRGEG